MDHRQDFIANLAANAGQSMWYLPLLDGIQREDVDDHAFECQLVNFDSQLGREVEKADAREISRILPWWCWSNLAKVGAHFGHRVMKLTLEWW